VWGNAAAPVLATVWGNAAAPVLATVWGNAAVPVSDHMMEHCCAC